MQDPVAVGDLLSYYRLMATWLLHLVSPDVLGSSDIQLPLPMPAPMEFRTLPVRATGAATGRQCCLWCLITSQMTICTKASRP